MYVKFFSLGARDFMSVRTFPHTDQKQRAYRVHTMLHDTEPLDEVVSNPIAKRQSIRMTAICSKHDSLPIAAHPTSLSPHVRNKTTVCEAHHPRRHQGLRMREPSPTAKSWHLHATSFILASRPPHAALSSTWENPGFARYYACRRMIRLCRGHRRIMRRTFILPGPS